MSISISTLKKALQKIAPLEMQAPWDNSGMQIELGRSAVKRILVCLEITRDVVTEALDKEADFIVTHHPLLFHGIKRIDRSSAAGSSLIDLITAGISVYSAHTCFDSAPGGNNSDLAERLQLCRISGLYEKDYIDEGEKFGDSFPMGAQGYLHAPMKLSDFARRLDLVLDHPGGIKIAGDADCMIQKVGLCTGAGGEFLPLAEELGCDVYISGDLKHHEVQEVKERGLCVIDAGHYGTEFLFVENMAKQLRAQLLGKKVEVLESQVSVNPYDFVL